jgi:hypothetical protein
MLLSVMLLSLQRGRWLDLSIRCHYIPAMKTELLQLRLDAIEKESFQKAAELAGVALSGWVRERLRKAARLELQDAGEKVPFIQALRDRPT